MWVKYCLIKQCRESGISEVSLDKVLPAIHVFITTFVSFLSPSEVTATLRQTRHFKNRGGSVALNVPWSKAAN